MARSTRNRKGGRQTVEKNINEMMAGRIQSKHLAIQHVRDRCQRMPVPRMSMAKRPGDPVKAETALHDGI